MTRSSSNTQVLLPSPSGPSALPPDSTLLAVSKLSRSFGGVQAVADVSFAVPPGSLLGLIGPNGAGKSTVMNILAGTERTDGGTVSFRGEVVTNLPDYKRARKGIVRAFQHPAVFGKMTVLESLLVAFPDLPGQTYRAVFSQRRRRWSTLEEERVEHAASLLDRFDMRGTANEYADNLSGGQKKLLDLLRAICAQPVLLLLDEPFAGVHLRNIEAVCQILNELRDDGVTILMTEHGLDLVDRLCEVVIIMARGSVIYKGSLAEGLREREVVQAYVAG
jgi:ABC-type branched-subunit amino acid transport system ATPase component